MTRPTTSHVVWRGETDFGPFHDAQWWDRYSALSNPFLDSYEPDPLIRRIKLDHADWATLFPQLVRPARATP